MLIYRTMFLGKTLYKTKIKVELIGNFKKETSESLVFLKVV